jgi:hypothetical protein
VAFQTSQKCFVYAAHTIGEIDGLFLGKFLDTICKPKVLYFRYVQVQLCDQNMEVVDECRLKRDKGTTTLDLKKAKWAVPGTAYLLSSFMQLSGALSITQASSRGL